MKNSQFPPLMTTSLTNDVLQSINSVAFTVNDALLSLFTYVSPSFASVFSALLTWLLLLSIPAILLYYPSLIIIKMMNAVFRVFIGRTNTIVAGFFQKVPKETIWADFDVDTLESSSKCLILVDNQAIRQLDASNGGVWSKLGCISLKSFDGPKLLVLSSISDAIAVDNDVHIMIEQIPIGKSEFIKAHELHQKRKFSFCVSTPEMVKYLEKMWQGDVPDIVVSIELANATSIGLSKVVMAILTRKFTFGGIRVISKADGWLGRRRERKRLDELLVWFRGGGIQLNRWIWCGQDYSLSDSSVSTVYRDIVLPKDACAIAAPVINVFNGSSQLCVPRSIRSSNIITPSSLSLKKGRVGSEMEIGTRVLMSVDTSVRLSACDCVCKSVEIGPKKNSEKK